ncbi:13022_t:CDS:2, partial [Cetraspora pellucida]
MTFTKVDWTEVDKNLTYYVKEKVGKREYAKHKYLIKEQQTQLGEVLKKFKIIGNDVKKDKRKKPSKNSVDICFQLFHSHIQISDERMKKQLKKMLENDEEYAEQLQKLNNKEELWSIFGINRVKLFSKKYTKEQIREWKKNSKQVYKDLYNPSDLDNSNSNIFLSLII